MPPILDQQPSHSMTPKEYISSIESSGMPKIGYIMDKHRASTVDYVIENDPPKLVSKPRSKSLPKNNPCQNCKRHCSNETPCDRCGKGTYCSNECQYAHWSFHKKNCRDLGMVIKLKRKSL
ncbi:hypothetical protein PPL_07525 [Heterostelium album PN500]|uniref:MYND-type domain-containing protein n=1 Tax=Heterostelium pallidum (strain ATCC 26659 / Pp 5 / PN500) TaxID=670386 RepID=D3BG74_HETP5|nr:hypothetical protein PPL_07525 [Heterostelium album PN500]EFA79666.1 hypothetical protein PPL_07525 [Heterostelium album PN500]|eukprot:XP_020431787.1 hypothetical protein PPL_07525 [Heterostelium album PN500]